MEKREAEGERDRARMEKREAEGERDRLRVELQQAQDRADPLQGPQQCQRSPPTHSTWRLAKVSNYGTANFQS